MKVTEITTVTISHPFATVKIEIDDKLTEGNDVAELRFRIRQAVADSLRNFKCEPRAA